MTRLYVTPSQIVRSAVAAVSLHFLFLEAMYDVRIPRALSDEGAHICNDQASSAASRLKKPLVILVTGILSAYGAG